MENEERINYLIDKFIENFKTKPSDIFSSPGRIELCGNHTDHNNGKVLVASIDLNILAAVSQNSEPVVEFISEGYKPMIVNLNDLASKPNEYGTSLALIKGVLYKMKDNGYKIGGFKVFCNSTIFKGAGVSSSAAFEVLIAKIVSYYYNQDKIEPFKLACISQFAESVYFNKPCGLLDQSGIAIGGINYIDFESTSEPVIKSVKLDIPDYQFILINTGDDHTKLTSCYASIKDDMKTVSKLFNVDVLRKIPTHVFYEEKAKLISKVSPCALLRAEHFFEENIRVQTAYSALEENNIETLFKMMDESGKSSYSKLQNCYVNNEDEKLPQALKYCASLPQTVCSRVHGGGFAGTMLLVVKKVDLKDVYPTLCDKFGKPNVMLVNVSKDGTTHVCSVGE